MPILNFTKDCLQIGDVCYTQNATMFTVIANNILTTSTQPIPLTCWNSNLTYKGDGRNLDINGVTRGGVTIWTRPAKVSFIVGVKNPSLVKQLCFDAVMAYPALVASEVFIASIGNAKPPFDPVHPYNMGLTARVCDAKHFDGDENSDVYKTVYSLFQNCSNLVTFYFYDNTHDVPIFNPNVFNADWTKTIQFNQDGEELVSTTTAVRPEPMEHELWEMFRIKIGDDSWAYLSSIKEHLLTFDDEPNKGIFVLPSQHTAVVDRLLKDFKRDDYNDVQVQIQSIYYTKIVATAFVSSTDPNKSLSMPVRILTIFDSNPFVSPVVPDERVCIFVMQYGNMPETYVMNDVNDVLLWTTTKTDAKQYKVQAFTPMSELIIRSVTPAKFSEQMCKVMCHTYARDIVKHPGKEPFARNVIVAFDAKLFSKSKPLDIVRNNYVIVGFQIDKRPMVYLSNYTRTGNEVSVFHSARQNAMQIPADKNNVAYQNMLKIVREYLMDAQFIDHEVTVTTSTFSNAVWNPSSMPALAKEDIFKSFRRSFFVVSEELSSPSMERLHITDYDEEKDTLRGKVAKYNGDAKHFIGDERSDMWRKIDAHYHKRTSNADMPTEGCTVFYQFYVSNEIGDILRNDAAYRYTKMVHYSPNNSPTKKPYFPAEMFRFGDLPKVVPSPYKDYCFEYTLESGSPMGYLKSDFFYYKLSAPSLIMAIETFKRIHPDHRQGQIQKINGVPYKHIDYFLNQLPQLVVTRNDSHEFVDMCKSIIDMF